MYSRYSKRSEFDTLGCGIFGYLSDGKKYAAVTRYIQQCHHPRLNGHHEPWSSNICDESAASWWFSIPLTFQHGKHKTPISFLLTWSTALKHSSRVYIRGNLPSFLPSRGWVHPSHSNFASYRRWRIIHLIVVIYSAEDLQSRHHYRRGACLVVDITDQFCNPYNLHTKPYRAWHLELLATTSKARYKR